MEFTSSTGKYHPYHGTGGASRPVLTGSPVSQPLENLKNSAKDLPGKTGKQAKKVIDHIAGWPKRLSRRLSKRIEHFDREIACFRQRRWS